MPIHATCRVPRPRVRSMRLFELTFLSLVEALRTFRQYWFELVELPEV